MDKNFLRLICFHVFLNIFIVVNCADDQPFTFQKEILKLVNDTIAKSFGKITNEVSPQCKTSIAQLINKEKGYLYLLKLLRDSSHTMFDLGSYHNCLSSIYYLPSLTDNTEISTKEIMKNLTYILVHIESSYKLLDPKENPYLSHEYLFGLCIPKECTNEEFEKLLKLINIDADLYDVSLNSEMSIYDVNQEIKITKQFYYGIVPLSIFFIIFLFDLFPKVPRCLFKCCFKREKKSSFISEASQCVFSDGDIDQFSQSLMNKTLQSYDFHSLSMLKKCFKIKENFGDILSTNVSIHDINSESGISIVRGLRGIFIILYIFGSTFQAIRTSPLRDSYTKIIFDTYLSSSLFFINRFSKKMLITLSMYTLSYKMLCFLDRQVEKIDLRESESGKDDDDDDDESNEALPKSKSDFNLIKSEKNTQKTELTKQSMSCYDLNRLDSYLFNSFEYYKKLSYKPLFGFLFRHLYKYIIFVSVLIFGKFSFYEVTSLLFTRGPLMEMVKQMFIDKVRWKHIFGHIFLYYPFTFQLKDTEEKENRFYWQPFDLVILEHFFFIMSTIFIFVSYKYNLRFDIFLFSWFLFGFFLKILVFLLLYFFTKSIYSSKGPFYPAQDFLQPEWNFLRANPFEYIIIVPVGLFFGTVNYVIQNSKRENNDKKYLTFALIFFKKLQIFQTLKLITFTVIFLVVFFWGLCSFKILFHFFGTNLEKDFWAFKFYKFVPINIYFLLDVDLVVCLAFMAIIPYTLLGENLIVSFLKSHYWNILSRPYYIFLIFICGIINWFICQTETRLGINLPTIFMFSSVSIFFGSLFCTVFYALFEMPLKKLSKFIIKGYSKRKRRREKEKKMKKEL